MILWQKKYNFDSILIDDIISQLVNDENSLDVKKNFNTSYFLNYKNRPENVFKSQYKKICNKITKDLGLHHRASLSFDTWMQVYTNKSKKFGPHDHFSGNEFLSWVHFLREPEEQCFCFIDSRGNRNYPQIESGDLIVFPSWTWHEASPPKHYEGYRTIIAGNIYASILFMDKSNDKAPKMVFDRFNNSHGGTWKLTFDDVL